jgi:hypothetical protein
MVANFVLADHGWLQSPDGKESSCVLFHAGKNHEGYFDHQNICDQAAKAMEILQKHYLDEDYVFIFDNATTHLKCPDGALLALKMMKGPSANFMVKVNSLDDMTMGKCSMHSMKRFSRKEFPLEMVNSQMVKSRPSITPVIQIILMLVNLRAWL